MGRKIDCVERYVTALIDARLKWAASDEGRRVLGPGSPTVPGLQDLYAIKNRILAIKVNHTSRENRSSCRQSKIAR